MIEPFILIALILTVLIIAGVLLCRPKLGLYLFLAFAPFSYYYAYLAVDRYSVGTVLQKSFKDVFIIVIYLFLVIYILVKKKTSFAAPKSGQLILLFVGVAIMGVASVLSSSIYASLIGLRNMIEFVPLVFLVPLVLVCKEDIQKAICLSLSCCIMVVFLGFYEIYVKSQNIFLIIMAGFRVSSTLFNPNNLGAYLACFLLVVQGLYLNEVYYINKRISRIIIFMFIVILIFTFSRSAVIGYIIGAITLIAISKKMTASLLVKLCAIISLFLCIVFFLAYNPIGKNMNYMSHEIRNLNINSFQINRFSKIISPDEASLGRIKAVDSAWKMLVEKPYLLLIGAGFDKTTGIATLDNDSSAKAGKWVGSAEIPSDNFYLSLLMGGGIFSLVLFCLMLFLLTRESIKLSTMIADPFLKGLSQSISAIFVAYSVIGLFMILWSAFPCNFYFWFFAGLLASVKRITKGFKITNAA